MARRHGDAGQRPEAPVRPASRSAGLYEPGVVPDNDAGVASQLPSERRVGGRDLVGQRPLEVRVEQAERQAHRWGEVPHQHRRLGPATERLYQMLQTIPQLARELSVTPPVRRVIPDDRVGIDILRPHRDHQRVCFELMELRSLHNLLLELPERPEVRLGADTSSRGLDDEERLDEGEREAAEEGHLQRLKLSFMSGPDLPGPTHVLGWGEVLVDLALQARRFERGLVHGSPARASIRSRIPAIEFSSTISSGLNSIPNSASSATTNWMCETESQA